MWESDKSHQCWADQTEEGRKQRKICIGVWARSLHSNVCWFVKVEGKFRESCPLPLEASIATWERLQNVISRNR